MALRDISNVTQTLINLIERAFMVPANWTGSAPTVMASPPVRTGTEGIGIYLYHLTENTHYKNLPSPGRDQPAVRFASMGLNLYYQLSANSTSRTPEANNALAEQEMMAVAIKTLHDYPELSDTTTVVGSSNTNPVFPDELRGRSNRFKISLQPIPPSEAVSFWTPGEAPLTLATYYEVSVVLLEPETIMSRSGKVTEYNVFTFASGAPRIMGSRNTLSFASPIDGSNREILLQPAQAPVGSPVTFEGADFSGGTVRLMLINSRWDEPAYADAPWNVEVRSQELSATIQSTAAFADGSVADILPGVYGARVEVTRTHPASGQKVSQASNQSPFMVAPRIDLITVPGNIAGTWTVAGYIFQATGPGGEELIDLEVFVGQYRLTQVEAPTPLSQGTFMLSTPQSLQFILPAGLSSGQVLPIRIFANGGETPPQWITLP